ncbi:nuclear transport factor 2 family protein, partial [Streptomyces sp. B1866]|uniref:nuclear transport factor 2 family protein n=1 Tax=Streptomyces sp. B1866 TaxID=3075431 RepID=UPI0028925852
GDAARTRWAAGGRLAGYRLPAALGVATVVLGGFAVYAGTHAADLRDRPAARNSALSDGPATSQVQGAVAKGVGQVFSYNYADPKENERAVKDLLTGKAVKQQRDMFAQVRAQGEKKKIVLTTTVTNSGVEMLDGDRARLLVYADQRNTQAVGKGQTTYAAALFAVDAVRDDGTWKISNIDTFNR